MDGAATRRAVPAIPRAEWVRHRNYPEHVLLLGSHENFRAISRRVIERAGTGEQGEIQAAHWLFDRWLSAMRSHEAYEEHKLYPYLESRYEASCHGLREGHEGLHRLEARARDLFTKTRAEPEGPWTTELVAALEAFDFALDEHLTAEEDLVLPMLLDLPSVEFRRYVSLPLTALLDSA